MEKPYADVFIYKKLGFTKYIEEKQNSWLLKIISNLDSELIYECEFENLFQLNYLQNDVTLKLDEYITLNRGEHEAVGEYLKGWRLNG